MYIYLDLFQPIELGIRQFMFSHSFVEQIRHNSILTDPYGNDLLRPSTIEWNYLVACKDYFLLWRPATDYYHPLNFIVGHTFFYKFPFLDLFPSPSFLPRYTSPGNPFYLYFHHFHLGFPFFFEDILSPRLFFEFPNTGVLFFLTLLDLLYHPDRKVCP